MQSTVQKTGDSDGAFVTSPSGRIGPWNINDGLCTLEQHRQLPIDVQVKHLWATGVIDDIIIGNAYASDQELESLSQLNRSALELKIKWHPEATALEKHVSLNDFFHLRRGDISEYMIRSTNVRVKYKKYEDFPVRTSQPQSRGDVFIGNNQFGKYKGELQVILKEMPMDERKNPVGQVVAEELFLLDYIHPWGTFLLKEWDDDTQFCISLKGPSHRWDPSKDLAIQKRVGFTRWGEHLQHDGSNEIDLHGEVYSVQGDGIRSAYPCLFQISSLLCLWR